LSAGHLVGEAAPVHFTKVKLHGIDRRLLAMADQLDHITIAEK